MALESVLSFFSRAHRIHIENCNFVASAQPHHVPPLSPPASSVSPPTPSASSRSMDAPSRPASSPIPPVTPVNSEALFIPVAASSVDQPRVKESPFELYGRTLLVAKRGYALWKPKPQGVSLPDAYKQEGARIGDVGFLNEYGGFSYLFNVFRSADDPINLGRVPPDFIPFPIENHHSIEEYLEEFEPGSHVASEPSEISKSNILFPEGQAPIPGVPEDVGAGLTFTSSAIEGAFLILPEGGKRVDYRHWITLYNYTAKCAQAWYKFINGDLDQGGQAMGLREGLYLVTGCDKARAWGAASFNSARPQEKPVHLDFVPKVADRIGGIPGYRFSRCDYAATSSGADVFGTQSGCVFLRGFRIAIRWGTKNPFKLVSEVTFTANMDADEFMRSIHTATHHSSNPELHLVTGDPFPGGSSYDDEASLPERYHVYHPLDGINRWILDNHNEVDIAITHDADWASIVQEASISSGKLAPLLMILTRCSLKM
ncbi:hypothetical protein GYMLUDRAFT_35476 [Collybiopsis luxurians FD-317 M1]|nr:hypothetical protein GYMLUDRAFT_35476 [Collybiopsis luxurians FD-317 M1]